MHPTNSWQSILEFSIIHTESPKSLHFKEDVAKIIVMQVRVCATLCVASTIRPHLLQQQPLVGFLFQ